MYVLVGAGLQRSYVTLYTCNIIWLSQLVVHTVTTVEGTLMFSHKYCIVHAQVCALSLSASLRTSDPFTGFAKDVRTVPFC